MVPLDDLWRYIKHKSNVVGYSKKHRLRVKNGKPIDEECFRVYVSKKQPLPQLRTVDIIPKTIEGIPVDVYPIGLPTIIPPAIPLEYNMRVRPLVAGVSIGNESITAGTLGWFFEKKDVVALGSNAHVFAEDPLKPNSGEKDILQPGSYDGGDQDDKVASYLWHQQLYGGASECSVAGGVAQLLNGLSYLSGAKTRFRIYIEGVNRIDFAVAEPIVSYEFELYKAKCYEGFKGLGFAGSDQASFFCKAEYITKTGWEPVGGYEHVEMGEEIHKIGRTTEHTRAPVIDNSAHGTVSYGGLTYVELDDIFITEKLLEGGDSGSSGWRSISA